MIAEEGNSNPIEMTEEDVQFSKEGKFKEIHERKVRLQERPVELAEKEVQFSKEGKFKEIHERKV